VGKTAVAIELAKRLNTSIISADSRQCYREMSVGTAKPSAEELDAVKHYFVDEFPVTTNVTAADFEQLGLKYLETIFQTSDAVVVCGGTGLYIKALTEGLDEMPKVDDAIEAEVNKRYEEEGLAWLQEAVKAEDPAFAATGEMQNPARLLRALVFVRSTGESITKYRSGQRKERSFDVVKVRLGLTREELYQRIDKRVNEMMEKGLEAEARELYPFKELKNLQTVGYSELFDYFDGKWSLAEAVSKIKQHTRNYAKRQVTWFKKDREMHWLEADSEDVVEQILGLK
jgi:tRNA dimethylallyltransferase